MGAVISNGKKNPGITIVVTVRREYCYVDWKFPKISDYTYACSEPMVLASNNITLHVCAHSSQKATVISFYSIVDVVVVIHANRIKHSACLASQQGSKANYIAHIYSTLGSLQSKK